MPDSSKDVKPTDPVQDPKSAPADVKPPEVEPVAPGVKPIEQPDPEPGVKTDPGLLLKSLQEERDKRRAADARVDQMKSLYGDKMQWDANGNPVAPVQQGPQADLMKKVDELWEQDPRKGVQAEIMVGFQWYDSINTALDQQRATVRQKYPDFNQYEVNAMQYVRTLPLEQRSKDGVIELAYLIQKGQNSTKLYEQAQEEVIKKLQAGESIQGLAATQAQVKTSEGKQPTEEQVKAAGAMNIPIEEYMKHVK